MSQYFSAKLEIVVRQATDGKKMIATAPEIYSPRVSRVTITCTLTKICFHNIVTFVSFWNLAFYVWL